MLSFIEGIVAPLFYKLLYMSLTALAIGTIVLLIRRFADRFFSPFWKYIMWLLVLAALVLPFRPQVDSAPSEPLKRIQSIQNLFFNDDYKETKRRYEYALQITDPTPEQSMQITEVKNKVVRLEQKVLVFDYIIPGIWLFGMIVMCIYLIIGSLKLNLNIKRTKFVAGDERYEDILQVGLQKLKLKSNVRVVNQNYIKTPALYGVFFPKIVLPKYIDDFSYQQLEHITLHELSHLKRKDNLVNAILLVLRAIYWFNPLLFLFFKFIREDLEINNDSSVVKSMNNENKKKYCYSLLDLLNWYDKPAYAPRLLCMVDDEKNIKRRIKMIKQSKFYEKQKFTIAIVSVVIIALLSISFLTVYAESGYSGEQSIFPFVEIKSIDNQTLEWPVDLLPEGFPKDKNAEVYSIKYFNDEVVITAFSKEIPLIYNGEVVYINGLPRYTSSWYDYTQKLASCGFSLSPVYGAMSVEGCVFDAINSEGWRVTIITNKNSANKNHLKTIESTTGFIYEMTVKKINKKH